MIETPHVMRSPQHLKGSVFKSSVLNCDQGARYLESSAQLAARTRRGGMGRAIDDLSDDDRAFLFGRAVERYINKQSLIGSPEQLRERIEALAAIGVDEIACFVDFELAPADILRGIDTLARHADPAW